MKRVFILGILIGCVFGNAALAANPANGKTIPTAEYQLQKDRFTEAKTNKIKPPMQSEQYFETKRTLKYDPSNIPGAGLSGGNAGMPSGAGVGE
ncbi:MAG TPA: hypothetical protein V6C76_01160 [Drouetiella sp.]